MLDLIYKVDVNKKVRYVWFDTGLEYQATKDHLEYLENRYGIKIDRIRAVKPIPLCTKEFGQPFLSKMVSTQIEMLQKNGFKFEDKPYEELQSMYPNIANSGSLKWWCNKYPYDHSIWNIEYNRMLKEFLIQNPPTFKISARCCEWAKKRVKRQIEYDLIILGIRKSEGGVRNVKIKSCYTQNEDTADIYRPLFWMTYDDKAYYDKLFSLKHSDCYGVWGFLRTGCAGCPFNYKVHEDLVKVKTYEPKLYNAIQNIFKDSYEYTKQYRQFVKDMKNKEKGRQSLF